jgi:hypothetical protein
MDPVFELVKKMCKGDQGKQRKLENWIKAGGPYPDYFEKSQLFRLSDEQRVDLDRGAIAHRVASAKKVDATWQKLLDMKDEADEQIKELKEDRARSTGVYRGLYEKAFATAKSFQDREARWHTWIQSKMDTLEKFELYADEQVVELNAAREKHCVEAITTEVLKDYKKYLVKTRKRKRWGGDRKSTKFIAMEFATKDVKGAKSLDDTGMRVSTMLAMASHAGHYDEKLTKDQKFFALLRKSGPSASDQS